MIDAFSGMDAIQDLLFFMIAIGRNDDRDWFLKSFLRSVTEEVFRSGVPTRDNPVKFLADNRVVGGFDNGGQTPARFFVCLALTDITQIRGENRRAVDLQGRDRQFNQNFRAIFPHSGDFDALANDRALARFQIMSETAPMLFAHARRND